MAFKILTQGAIGRIIEMLTPRFLGRDQDHLLGLADETADAAYQRAFDDIEPIQDFIADLQSPAGASLIGISDIGGFYSGTDVEAALQQIGPTLAGGPYQPLDSDLTALASNATTGLWTKTGVGTGTTRTLTGTANRLDVTNGDGVAGNPSLNISATYVGQTSITTLGTIGTGTWNASTIAADRGGTGISSYTAGNYINALNSTTLQQRTPAQVKTDLALTKADVGLSNVDNTSDVNKPVSTAQATADNLRVLKSGDNMTGNLGINQTSGDYNVIVLSNSGGVQTHYVANNNADGRIGTITNHPFVFLQNGSQRGSIDTGGFLQWQSAIFSNGSAAGFTFVDRTSSRAWVWYGTADVARLYNGSSDIVTVNSVGDTAVNALTIAGTKKITSITVSSSAPGALADGALWLRY